LLGGVYQKTNVGKDIIRMAEPMKAAPMAMAKTLETRLLSIGLTPVDCEGV
jgi:hypothetical protein